jgi:hypothetical protein
MAKKDDDEDRVRDVGDWGSDSIPIVVDSACSASMTPFKTDLRNIRPYTSSVAGSSKITHVGEVSWCVKDINGKDVYLQDDLCYLAPNDPYRLLCPHNWKKHCNKKRYVAGETEGDQATFPNDSDNDYILSWNRGRNLVCCTVDPTINLPIVHTSGEFRDFKAFVSAFKAFPNVIEDDDDKETDEAMPIATNTEDVSDLEDSIESTHGNLKTNHFTAGPNEKEPTVLIDDQLHIVTKISFSLGTSSLDMQPTNTFDGLQSSGYFRQSWRLLGMSCVSPVCTASRKDDLGEPKARRKTKARSRKPFDLGNVFRSINWFHVFLVLLDKLLDD